MADNSPGLAPPPAPMTQGQVDYNEVASKLGVQAAEEFKRQETQKMTASGVTSAGVSSYWGDNPARSPEVEAQAKNRVQRNLPAIAPNIASNPWEAIAAGWDQSSGGMALNLFRGKAPDPHMVLPENANLYSKIAAATGQFVGDLPATIAGFTVGGAAGAAVPGAGETGISELAGGGFGGAAMPAALRHSMVLAYNSGQYHTSGDFAVAVAKGAIDTVKEGAIGAVANLAGGKAGQLAFGAASDAVAPTLAKLAGDATNITTQTAVATTAGAAAAGRLPNSDDFISGMVIALGAHGGTMVRGHFQPSEAGSRVQRNLQEIYEQTGKPPWQVMHEAQTDPALMQEVMQQGPGGEAVIPNHKAAALDEPAPYGGPDHGSDAWAQNRMELAGGKLDTLLSRVRSLEGSGDTAVSTKGAIGRYQIMPGTARQYGLDPERLSDPKYSEMAARKILTDLNLRYHGDEAAVLTAYNAGPGRAHQLLNAGPGERLEAVRDNSVKSGWVYHSVEAGRDESFLPLETQRYLARARGASGGELKGNEMGPMQEPPHAAATPPKDLEAEALEALRRQQTPTDDMQAKFEEQAQKEQAGWDQVHQEAQKAAEESGEGEWFDRLNLGEAIRRVTRTANGPAIGGPEDWYAKIGEQIADADRPQSFKELASPDRLYRQYLSDLGPARQLDQALVDHYGMNRTKDVGVEDVFRQTKASDGRAAAMIKWGIIDPRTNSLVADSPSFFSAAKLAKDNGGNLQNWVRYMLAKRAVDLEERGIKSGFSMPEAHALAADEGEAAKYDEATRQLNDSMTGVLKYAQGKGLYSAEQVQAMVDANPTYLTMQRAIKAGEDSGASGGTYLPRQLRQIKGSDRQVVDPLEATLWNIHRITANADRNEAIGYVVKLAEQGFLAKEVGMEKIAEEPIGADPLKAMLAEPALKSDPEARTFTFFRDGVKETWQTKDPELAQLFQKVASKGEADFLSKVVNTFAGIQRSGIVGAADFPLRIMIRHQFQAAIADPLHPTPFTTWIKGIGHVLGQDEAFKDWFVKGGAGTTLAEMDTNYLQKDIERVFEETGVTKALLNVVKSPLEALHFVNSRLDAAARLGYTEVAKEKGLSPIKAATMSRTAYLDYAERGSSEILQGMAKAVPFLRPHLLGMKQLGDAWSERPLGTSVAAFMTLVVPAIGLNLLNRMQDQSDLKDKPDRQFAQLPRWEKDTMFILPEIAGQRLKIPTPPVIGPAFVGMTNRLIDAVYDHDPHAFDDWSKSFLDQLIPNLIPPIASPAIEAASNYSFQSHKPLVPGSLTQLSPDLQYTRSTTEPAKKLSRVLGDRVGAGIWNQSPIVTENYIKSWGGTLGGLALDALNAPFKKPGPPGELSDIPFVKGFLVRHPGAQSQTIEDFYTEEKQFAEAHADYAKLKKQVTQGQDDMSEDFAAQAGDVKSHVKLAWVTKAFQNQQMVLESIYKNKDMNVDEKRQKIEQVYIDMIHTAEDGLNEMHGVTEKTNGR